MCRIFHDILLRADSPNASIFTADEVTAWPKGVLKNLLSLHILRKASSAREVECRQCERNCPIRPEVRDDPRTGKATGVYFCKINEDVGRFTVDLSRLKRWEIDLAGFATALAEAMSAAGGVEVVVPGRLYLLGRLSVDSRACDVFFAVGLSWPDGKRLLDESARFQASAAPLMVVPSKIPQRMPSADVPLLVKTVGDIASVTDAGLTVDLSAFTDGIPKKRKAKMSPTTFPTPPGTNWDKHVRIMLKEFGAIIDVKGKRREYSFADMGFGNKQKNNGVPDAYWAVLRTFARFGGQIQWQTEGVSKSEKDNLKAQVSELRKRLKAFFGLTEDPFHKYTKKRGYCTRFALAAGDGVRFPTPDGAKWDDVTITLTEHGQFRFEVETTQRLSCHVYDRTEDDSRGGHREVIEQSGSVERIHDHRMLGLSLQNEEPDRIAKALVRVIKGAGRVRDLQANDAMIGLGGFLTEFFGISTSSPFEFEPKPDVPDRGEWVARFNTTR